MACRTETDSHNSELTLAEENLRPALAAAGWDLSYEDTPIASRDVRCVSVGAACPVTWRRTTRRVRVKETRSGSCPALRAAWCIRSRSAWWTIRNVNPCYAGDRLMLFPGRRVRRRPQPG